MSLVLQKIELSNIRSHKHFVFEPGEHGVTAISGPNGTGKSTIVDSIAWALYGTKPNGVSKAAAIYRDKAEWGTDKCFAVIDLLVDNIPYQITRRMVNRQGGTECTVLRGDNNGGWLDKPVAGPAVSHSSLFIKQLLKMDENGFLTSVLIQQKQVDQLVTSTPRERRLVIEKLTGITSITEAITQARQEYNILRQALSLSTASPDEGVRLKKERKELQAKQVKFESKDQALTVEVNELKSDITQLQKDVEHEDSEITRTTLIREELSALRAVIATQEKQLAALIDRKGAMKSELLIVISKEELAKLEKKVDSLREQQSEINTKIHLEKNEISTLEEKLLGYIQLLSKYEGMTLIEMTNKHQESKSKLEKVTNKIQSLEKMIDRGSTSVDRLQNAIQVISDSEDGECPTCLQKVNDVQLAVSSLQDEIVNIKAEIVTNTASLSENTKFSSSSSQKITELEELILATSNKTEVESELTGRRKNLTTMTSNSKTIVVELKTLVKTYDESKRSEMKMESYNRILKECQTTSDEIETLKSNEAKKALQSKTSVTASEHNAKKNRLGKLHDSQMIKSNFLTKLKGELRLLNEQLSNLTEKIVKNEADLRKNRELLKGVEVARNSIAVLDEFRANRIDSSVPLIESYASDFLNRFTEGKFTQLRLNSKFDASVGLASGTTRAIGILSGGEVSAAALALRLAISKVIDGGNNHSLIIMDEVFASQDASRAELILASVKEICNGQTILIAHNDSINDFSDQIVEL
jgi:exonuclease SbcC